MCDVLNQSALVNLWQKCWFILYSNIRDELFIDIQNIAQYINMQLIRQHNIIFGKFWIIFKKYLNKLIISERNRFFFLFAIFGKWMFNNI